MMKKNYTIGLAFFLGYLFYVVPAFAYPLDGYETTGIRRLKRLELIRDKKMAGPVLSSGSGHPLDAIFHYLLESFPRDGRGHFLAGTDSRYGIG